MEPAFKNPSHTRKRVVTWLGIGVCSTCLLIGLQRFLIPEVDETLTTPVVIDRGGTNLVTGDTDPDANRVSESSITFGISQAAIDQAEHPVVPLIDVARKGIQEIDKNIFDYTSTMISQIYVDEKLYEEKYVFCKVRHPRETANGKVPFSVYVKFLKPRSMVGKEVIWVEGRNSGKLIAHEVGLKNVMRFPLDPTGAIAMEGNRYPIDCFGFRNLYVKMIEFCEQDRKHDDCRISITRDIKINGRKCTLLESFHEHENKSFGFHIARMYIDDQWNIPIAYEGYRWPEQPGEQPPLLEKYYYTDLQFNVGLTDRDFDPSNPEYDYPKW